MKINTADYRIEKRDYSYIELANEIIKLLELYKNKLIL